MPYPQNKVDRYAKIKVMAERGTDAERETARGLLAGMEASHPGIGAEAAQQADKAESERLLREALQGRGWVPPAPTADATSFERLFILGINWAMGKLAETADPDAMAAAIRKQDRKRKPKPNPETTMATQAERVLAALEKDGQIAVEFFADDETAAEPSTVEINIAIPWKLVERLSKSKTVTIVLADWILEAIEAATLEDADEPSSEVGEAEGGTDG